MRSEEGTLRSAQRFDDGVNENVGHTALSAMIWDDRFIKVRKHDALRELVSDEAVIADGTHFVRCCWISIHRGQASLRTMIWDGALRSEGTLSSV